MKEIYCFTANELREVIAGSVEESIRNEISRVLNSPNRPEKLFLTRKEAAKEIGVSLPTLRAWEQANILKPVRIGTRVRYRLEDIQTALSNSKNDERGRS